MVVSSPREDETPPRGPQTGSPIHDHRTLTVDFSPNSSEVGGARPLLRDEVFHPVPTAFRPIDTVIELRSDKLPHISNLSLEKLFFRGSHCQLWKLKIWSHIGITRRYVGQYCHEAHILLAFGRRSTNWEHGQQFANKKFLLASMSLSSADSKPNFIIG